MKGDLMRVRSRGWLGALGLLVLGFAALQAQEAKKPPPKTYKMKVAMVYDSSPREYVFVIGGLTFKSVASLEKFIAGLPPNSTIRWAPGCCRMGDEPLLSSKKDMDEFKAFCRDKKVQFVLVPSG